MTNRPSRASVDTLRLIAKNLTEMVLAYDMDRKLIFANPAVESLTGYTPEELERDNFICWVHPEDRQRMLSLWEELFEGKSFHQTEYRLVTKDGRVKWAVASWTPLIDDAGRQVGVMGREADITRRKLAESAFRHSEKQLREDEQRYRALFENSPFPMWEEDFSDVKRYLDMLAVSGVTDVRSYLASNACSLQECVRRVRILDINRAAREFYGAATKEELLGSLERIFDERAFEVFRDEVATLAENRSSFRTEFAVRTLQGEERLVDMIVSITDTASNDWSRVIVSFFDITDRKRLEEQVVQSQKMESLGRLAGGIAHDFNNLLTVINGYTDWILHEMEPENPYRNQLAFVRDAGAQCAELTQQLLAFSRKHIVQPGPLDLNRFILESSSMLDHVLGDDVRIVTHLAPDLGTIEADRSQMQQVLMNLAINAREAMPSGGTLTIETRNVNNASEVLLEIGDTGHGIDERTRRHLFEPFFTTRKGSKNTGLGLATVFGIVSQRGGRIEVLSEPGEGAVFRIYLPRIVEPSEPKPQNSFGEAPHSGSGIVLVVEDREDVRGLTCLMLEQMGYQPIPAACGSEAIEIAEHHQPGIHLLLTDVLMPDMNGPEVADRIRKIHPGIKVIFMSGYTDRIINSGAMNPSDVFLQKPFTFIELSELLNKIEESTA